MTPELRAAISAGNKRRWQDPEHQARQHVGHLGMRPGGVPADGRYVDAGGYRYLTGQWDHPLVNSNGGVSEARAALYDQIGPGPHECHWNYFSHCGEIDLEWGGVDGIQADHLDGDRLNNDYNNIVPSCLSCNRRGMRLIVARGGLHHNNTSGVTGVSWDKNTQKWMARAPGGRWLGRFGSLEAAAAAVEAAS